MIFLLSCAIAFAAPVQGFVTPAHPAVPPPVRAAAKSVFHVAVLPELRVPLASLHAILDSIVWFARDVLERQATTCAPDAACMVRGRVYYGSGFLTAPDQLTTAYHVLPPWRDRAYAYVFDQDGHLAFEGEVRLEVAIQTTEVYDEQSYRPTTDVARVVLPRAIGVPLVTATVAPGDRTFALGYPDATTGRTVNADGRSLRVTFGRALTLEDALARIGAWPRGLDNDAELHRRATLFTTNDSNQGSSGGPLVDRWGRVVGTVGAIAGVPGTHHHTTVAARSEP